MSSLKNKIIVYTINLGGYDKLNPAPKDKNAEYLYFTDGDKCPKGWKLMKIDTSGLLNQTGLRRESRHLKINSHLLPPHDISIYIDACYEIKKPLSELVVFLGDRNIAVPEHPRDNCVYQHAKRVMALNLDNKGIVNRQMRKYRAKRLPERFSISENCIIIRRNNNSIRMLNELWWREYLKESQRDQLSLPYARWVSREQFAWLPFSARENRWLDNWANHLGDRTYKLNN